MPFSDYTQFNGEALLKMRSAYDLAVARLNLKNDDPRTGELAAKIAALAAEGERDVEKLAERAVALQII
jgi:hypothetical protein